MVKIAWQTSVPIFKNKVILKQLGIAVGIPFGLVIIVIGLASGSSIYTLYGLGMVAALLLMTWAFLKVVYRGKYEVEFLLNDKGVLCRTQAGQAKKNRLVNTLTVIFGIFAGKPTTAGAGMLAQSRQEVFIPWNRVTKVKYKPQSHTILLRGGWLENMAMFCTGDNYREVKGLIMLHTKSGEKESSDQ